VITKHPRLLRSLSWGGEDYARNVLKVLRTIAAGDTRAIRTIGNYVETQCPGETEYISPKPSERKTTFAANVFHIPDLPIESDLVAVMPLRAEFDGVLESISEAAGECGLRSLRSRNPANHLPLFSAFQRGRNAAGPHRLRTGPT
jgi:hypothetical protein